MKKIIVIDDDRTIRLTLTKWLEDDFQVETAPDGPEGLELIRTVEPEVVLLDAMLPGMSGFEVCRRVRNDLKMTQVHIIMITALIDKEIELKAFRTLANDFIIKPLDRDILRAKLDAGFYSYNVRTQSTVNDQEMHVISKDAMTCRIMEAEYLFRRYQRPTSLLVLRLRGEHEPTRMANIIAKVSELLFDLRQVDKVCKNDRTSFAVLMPETPENAAILAAERLLRVLSAIGDDIVFHIGVADIDKHQYNLFQAANHYSQLNENLDQSTIYSGKNPARL